MAGENYFKVRCWGQVDGTYELWYGARSKKLVATLEKKDTGWGIRGVTDFDAPTKKEAKELWTQWAYNTYHGIGEIVVPTPKITLRDPNRFTTPVVGVEYREPNDYRPELGRIAQPSPTDARPHPEAERTPRGNDDLSDYDRDFFDVMQSKRGPLSDWQYQEFCRLFAQLVERHEARRQTHEASGLPMQGPDYREPGQP
jgi:hypothetical protein